VFSSFGVPTLLTAVLLFVSGIGVCRANIGDPEAGCIAKYGSESDVTNDVGYRQVGDKAATFNLKMPYGTLVIRVTFLRGLSCHESISNADASRGLSLEQLKEILNSQSAGFKWHKGRTVYQSGGGDTDCAMDWLRSDGATAKFWMSGKADSQAQSGQMDISTKEYTYAQHIYDKENGDN
jgi:hypothetical protein